MEVKKMGLKDSKGKEKDEDWPSFLCLVDAAVAVAVREEELKVEERLMKKTMRLKEGLKKIDNVVNNSSDFSKKPFVVTDKNLSLMNENPGTDIGESKTEEVSLSCIDPSIDSSKKQSFKAKKRRCFESGETSRAMKPKLKKKNKVTFGSQPYLPERLKEMIKNMQGSDEKLIIQKTLYNTDLSEHHGRLSIPMNQVKVEFLTDEEKNVLKQGSKEIIEALVIEPCLKTRDMIFKRWDMKKSTGKPCSLYLLTSKWKSVVEDNGLKVNDVIQVWSFRVNSKLCFALVIVH